MGVITYYIVADRGGALRGAARLACAFWNHFVVPARAIVVRLGVFTELSSRVIARAYRPYSKDNVLYVRVEYNTAYLRRMSSDAITTTVVHEIGHGLGIGWDRWMESFDHRSGAFFPRIVGRKPRLRDMRVETDYGPGTELAHWDEHRHRKALMSGIDDGDDEELLPETLDALEILGHTIKAQLDAAQPVQEVLAELKRPENQVFSLTDAVARLDRGHYVETEVWEELYSSTRRPFGD